MSKQSLLLVLIQKPKLEFSWELLSRPVKPETPAPLIKAFCMFKSSQSVRVIAAVFLQKPEDISDIL